MAEAVPYLAASLVALLVGPTLGAALERSPKARAAIEWGVTAGLMALIVAHVIPEAFELAGWWVLPVVGASVLATLGLERWAGAAQGSSMLVLALGMFALGVHSALDGAALSGANEPGGGKALAVAVVLHRLPTSMAIWWLVKRALGGSWAIGVIAWDGAATLVGYFAGELLFSIATPLAIGLMQAVIAGSLLHVAFHVRGHHGHAPVAAQ